MSCVPLNNLQSDQHTGKVELVKYIPAIESFLRSLQ